MLEVKLNCKSHSFDLCWALLIYLFICSRFGKISLSVIILSFEHARDILEKGMQTSCQRWPRVAIHLPFLQAKQPQHPQPLLLKLCAPDLAPASLPFSGSTPALLAFPQLSPINAHPCYHHHQALGNQNSLTHGATPLPPLPCPSLLKSL